MGLMDQAKPAPQEGPAFTPQDPRKFVPPEQHDAVEKVFVAGMKVMYSPQMADEREAALASPEPAPKVLADNVTGLLLTLDQQAKGGLPEQAIFPAGVLLVNEAATLLTTGGKQVTQEDYNGALQILYVQLGKKLGATDDQLMTAAQDALAKKQGGMPPEEQAQDTGAPVAPGKAPMTQSPGGGMAPPAGVQQAAPPPGSVP